MESKGQIARVLLIVARVSFGTDSVNVTGETLVLNKNFASIKQGFCQH